MRVRHSGTTGIGLLLAALAIAGCTPANVRTSTGPSAVTASIPLTDFGTGIAISPDGTRAYVAAGSKVQVIDVATNKVAASIELGDMPYSIALSNDGQRGYAVDLMQREVWFIDLVSNSVVKRVELGEPRRPVLRPGVAVSPDGRTVYATLSQPEGAGSDLLFSIDTTTGAKQQRALGFHPGDLVAAKDGRHVWVAGCRGLCSDGALHAVDPSDPGHATQLVLPTVPGEVAISPDGARYALGTRDGRAFLVGDRPGLVDATAWYPLWMARGYVAVTPALVAGFERLLAWEDRVRAIGYGNRREIAAADALATARDATPAVPRGVDPRDPLALAAGTRVSVTPDDYGKIPVEGELVAMDAHEVAVRRRTDALGEVVVHFPRIGYLVEPA